MRTSLSILSYSKRKPRWTVLWIILAIALTAAAAQVSMAQECDYDLRPNGYCPETNPRTNMGEERLNRFVYKSTHNSYIGDSTGDEMPMNEQIDNYNTYLVEMDVKYDLTYDPDVWWSEHCCNCPTGSQPLVESFHEIASAQTLEDRVTFLYLQSGCDFDCGCYDDWPARDVYFFQIENLLYEAGIDEDKFYRHDDFVNIDGKRWPSMQELVRRGQHVVVFFRELEDGSGAPVDEDFFFGVSLAQPPTDCCNFAMGNYPGGYDGDPVDGPPDDGGDPDRWLHRLWPDDADCGDTNGAFWDHGVDFGWNFVATNCVTGFVTDERTYSSMPIWVDSYTSVFDGCNQGFFEGIGTYGFPYSNTQFTCAVDRASPAVDIRLEAGTYTIPGDEYVINKPLVLKSQGGTVTITTEN